MDESLTRRGSRPDFFIVGAFKSGTTALYEYLRRHPQVFMPFHKEPNFFGDDLTRHYGRMRLDEYLELFEAAQPGQRVGEASSWYLYSSCAAREIADFSPGASIIVLLRNPIDVMHAQHSQLVFRSDETIEDFRRALEAEADRIAGPLPSPTVRRETLLYRRSVQFSEQLRRYYDVFGRSRVHVVLFDDLVRDTAGMYRSVLQFLEIDAEFRPEFRVYNENKQVRFPVIQRLAYRPPAPMHGLLRVLRRNPRVHQLRDGIVRLNSKRTKRMAMDPFMRAELIAEFTPEIQRLSDLIERDLSAWLA